MPPWVGVSFPISSFSVPNMALLKACFIAALAVSQAHADGGLGYSENGNGNSSLMEEYLEGFCKVVTVVESETLVNTCVSTPAILVVGCSTINITEPTCITTVITISSTITENYVQVQTVTVVPLPPPGPQNRPPNSPPERTSVASPS
jgi:hypothetical protein